jgi:hypothetical protein
MTKSIFSKSEFTLAIGLAQRISWFMKQRSFLSPFPIEAEWHVADGICLECGRPIGGDITKKASIQMLNDGNIHYFKLFSNLDVDIKPYITMPMYDEAPDMGSFHSTYAVPHPENGDYLIYSCGDISFNSSVRDFSEVSFENKHKIDIEDLLKKKIVSEVSPDVYSLDMDLSCKIVNLHEKIVSLEMEIDSMKDNKDFFSVQDILDHENDIAKIKKQSEEVKAEREKLYDSINK